MAQYRVSFIALAESTIEVEADSPEEALDLANAEFDYPVTWPAIPMSCTTGKHALKLNGSIPARPRSNALENMSSRSKIKLDH